MSPAERATRAKLDRILARLAGQEQRALADVKALGFRSLDHAHFYQNRQLELDRERVRFINERNAA